jgi:hypothetical protein
MEVYGGGRRDLFCTYNNMMETLPIIYKPKHPTKKKGGGKGTTRGFGHFKFSPRNLKASKKF